MCFGIRIRITLQFQSIMKMRRTALVGYLIGNVLLVDCKMIRWIKGESMAHGKVGYPSVQWCILSAPDGIRRPNTIRDVDEIV